MKIFRVLDDEILKLCPVSDFVDLHLRPSGTSLVASPASSRSVPNNATESTSNHVNPTLPFQSSPSDTLLALALSSSSILKVRYDGEISAKIFRVLDDEIFKFLP